MQQLAQVAISQLNDVFDNSSLNIGAILTGVEILNGFNYSPWSTFHCNVTSMPLNEDLYLRVTATCSDGRTAIDFFVTLNLDAPSLVSNYKSSFLNEEFNENLSKDFSIDISLNPVPNRKVVIDIQLPKDGPISIMLYDQFGRPIYSLSKGDYQKGNLNIFKTLPPIPTGMYFLRVIWNNQVVTKKVIIQ